MRLEVREARLDDLERIGEMARTYGEHGGDDVVGTVSPEAMKGLARNLIESEDGVVFVAVGADLVRGVGFGMKSSHPFSGESTACALGWWVDPDARGNGQVLLDALEGWAKNSGCMFFSAGAPVGSSLGRKYRARGYREVETVYVLRLGG